MRSIHAAGNRASSGLARISECPQPSATLSRKVEFPTLSPLQRRDHFLKARPCWHASDPAQAPPPAKHETPHPMRCHCDRSKTAHRCAVQKTRCLPAPANPSSSAKKRDLAAMARSASQRLAAKAKPSPSQATPKRKKARISSLRSRALLLA